MVIDASDTVTIVQGVELSLWLFDYILLATVFYCTWSFIHKKIKE